MASLPDLQTQINEVQDALALMDEDQEAAAIAFIGELLERRADKVDAIVNVLGLREATAAHLKQRSKELADRAKALESRNARFSEFLHAFMERNGLKKLEGREGSLSLRKSFRVEITDASEVPDSYKRVTVDVQPAKDKIKDAIRAGLDVPGARLVETQSLQVR